MTAKGWHTYVKKTLVLSYGGEIFWWSQVITPGKKHPSEAMVFSLGFTYIIFGTMYGVWNMIGGWDYSSRPNMLDSVWISSPYDDKNVYCSTKPW